MMDEYVIWTGSQSLISSDAVADIQFFISGHKLVSIIFSTYPDITITNTTM